MSGNINSGKMPVLFIGHGSPMNIILDNDYTQSLVRLGKELPRPEAIMVISAHWMTAGTFVTCNEKPKTIYDFYGFPRKLYEINYPSPGAPDKAELACQTANSIPVKCSNKWGLDHASGQFSNTCIPKLIFLFLR
ncbi:MAG: class III extradiol ring-cleavage dioxygenase [Methanolobus sp.]